MGRCEARAGTWEDDTAPRMLGPCRFWRGSPTHRKTGSPAEAAPDSSAAFSRLSPSGKSPAVAAPPHLIDEFVPSGMVARNLGSPVVLAKMVRIAVMFGENPNPVGVFPRRLRQRCAGTRQRCLAYRERRAVPPPCPLSRSSQPKWPEPFNQAGVPCQSR